VLDELPLVRVFMYYRAIQARYDVEGRAPRFEDDERSGAGYADFRRQIRSALAAFKRRKKKKKRAETTDVRATGATLRSSSSLRSTSRSPQQENKRTAKHKKRKSKVMKKLVLVLLLTSAIRIPQSAFSADDVVIPQQLNGIKLYRDVTSSAYSTNVHFTQGATIQFTNMVCYSSANLGTNSVIQGLSNVTVEISMSTSSSVTGTWSSATVQSSTLGTWYGTYTAVPAAATVYWQCRLTDTLTHKFYYTMQKLYADPHL
jgi:hypothetical protein